MIVEVDGRGGLRTAAAASTAAAEAAATAVAAAIELINCFGALGLGQVRVRIAKHS